MTLYRFKAVMDFLAKARSYVSINKVAKGVGMSWNTAKNDLEYLTKEGYVIKKGKKKFYYKLKYKK